MPAFRRLGKQELQGIVGYLRVLQGRANALVLAGDPQKGKAVFFGKAACSSCHMVAGQGGFAGSDLSTYAQALTASAVRNAITDPTPSNARARMAVATARDGQRFAGLIRNEDNFSVQMQSPDGTFHLLLKTDVEKLEYEPSPLMPTNYGEILTRQELDDLVGYLQSIVENAKPQPQKED